MLPQMAREKHSCNILYKKIKEFIGKFCNATMTHQECWVALQSVIEPAVMYPSLWFHIPPVNFSLLNRGYCSYSVLPLV